MKRVFIAILLVLAHFSLFAQIPEPAADEIRIPFEGKVAMKNGRWNVGWEGVVEIDESGSSPIYRVNGGEPSFGFSTDFIGLDQTEPEPIRIDGWIRRTASEDNSDTLVRYWMELWFQDGTSQWYNGCPSIPGSEAGNWIHIQHVCNPAKAIKSFRVICLNMNCPSPTEFRDLYIFIKKPAQGEALVGKTRETFEVGGMTVEVASGSGQSIVCGLTDKTTEWNFIPQDGSFKNIWRIVLRNKETGILKNIDAGGTVSTTAENEGLTIRWAEKELPEGELAVTVHALPAEDNLVDWTIQASLDSEEYSIESIFFPTFAEIQVPGEGEEQAIFYPQDTGRLIVDPLNNMKENLFLGYGGWMMTMQFLHFAGTDAGFYFSALDGAGYTKNFHVQLKPGQENPSFLVEHILARGTQEYTPSWPVRVGCVKGNWYDAAMEYRKWALNQVWCSKGTITQRGDEFPSPLKEIGLWIDWIDNVNPFDGDAWRALTAEEWSTLPPEEIMQRTGYTGYNTEGVIQNFTDLRNYYGVPLADYSHPYLHGFNVATPTYFVPPGLSPAMQVLKERGVYFVPWTSARLFDIKIPRFEEEHVVDYAVVGSDGNVKYLMDAVMMTPMCMHTEYWQNQIEESTLRLLNDGFTGIYYDELASTGGEICYSDQHGHPVGGGNYPLVARRKVMEDVHAAMRDAGHTDYFSNGEEASEFLFGVHDSNFLFASLFLDGVPALQAVYHEYVTSFSRTPGRWMDPYSGWYTSAYGAPTGDTAIEELVSHSCRNWSVGVNIGIVRRDLPTYSPEGAEIIRRFAQAYYANREYLLEGRMLRPPVIRDSVIQKVSWSAGNWSHGEQPMIYASLWEAPSGSIGLMVANAGVFAAAPLIDLQDALASESCYRLVDTMTNESLGVISGAEPVFRLPIEGRSPRTIELIPTQEQVSLPATQDFTVVFDHDFTARRTGDEGRVRFTVDNFAALPMSGTAILSWEGMEPQEQAFSLNAAGRTEVVFPVTVPEKTGKQSFTVTVRASNANGSMEETYTTYIGVKQAVAHSTEPKQYSAPHCGGYDIPADAPVITDLTSKIQNLAGAEDLSASARLGWCDDGLLLEFTVQDNFHVEPSPSAEEICLGDGIQFVVGVYYPEQGRMSYAKCVFTEIGGEPYVHVFDHAEAASLIQLNVQHDGDITIYKALIQRSFWPAGLSEGTKLPFSFTVNEADEDGYRGWLEWTPGLNGEYDPEAFGEVLLEASEETPASLFTFQTDNKTPLLKTKLTASVAGGYPIYFNAISADYEGKWTLYSKSIPIVENGTYYFKSRNANGDEITDSITFFNIYRRPAIVLATNSKTPVKQTTITAATNSGLPIYYSQKYTGPWSLYTAPIAVTENGRFYFKTAKNSVGQEGQAYVQFKNIDNMPPFLLLSGKTAGATPSATLLAQSEANAVITYNTASADYEGEWTTYAGAITVTENATYFFRATDQAGNLTAKSITFANITPTRARALLATRNIVTTTQEEEEDPLIDVHTVATGSTNTPQILTGESNDKPDVFVCKAKGVWGSGYQATHVGNLGEEWNGTQEAVSLRGKNKILDIFTGSEDISILLLTDDANGDALFLDDIFSALPAELDEPLARIAGIDEIYAGAGDDIVDMTSKNFAYLGEGMVIHGGNGNDVIWANKGSNVLYGDAGDDRLVGASGDDILDGGIGDDSLHGGGGNDTVRLCENWGHDTVEQLPGGKITLLLPANVKGIWNPVTMAFASEDGENTVAVVGISEEDVTIEFESR